MAVFISSSLQSQRIGPLIPQNHPILGHRLGKLLGPRPCPPPISLLLRFACKAIWGNYSLKSSRYPRVLGQSEKLLGAQTALKVGGAKVWRPAEGGWGTFLETGFCEWGDSEQSEWKMGWGPKGWGHHFYAKGTPRWPGCCLANPGFK